MASLHRRSVFALAIAVTTAAAASAPAVKTRLKDPVAATRTYDPSAERPEDMPVLEARDAVTVCDFWCKPVLSYRTVHRAPGAGSCRATVEVARAEVILELTVTSWLPDEAPRLMKRQEAAHRTICETAYRAQGKHAGEHAGEALAGRFEGEGEDCQDAVERAVHESATLGVCIPFASAGSAAARRVSDIYDQITRHGARRDLSTRRAIELSLELYRRETATAGGDAVPAGYIEKPRLK